MKVLTWDWKSANERLSSTEENEHARSCGRLRGAGLPCGAAGWEDTRTHHLLQPKGNDADESKMIGLYWAVLGSLKFYKMLTNYFFGGGGQEWLRAKHQTIRKWPSMSPDLNPIEHPWKEHKHDIWRKQSPNLARTEAVGSWRVAGNTGKIWKLRKSWWQRWLQTAVQQNIKFRVPSF